MLTKLQLQQCIPNNKEVDLWLPLLNKYLPEWNIKTPEQVAMFITQTAHESGGYTVLSENLNYSDAGLRLVFGKYFNKPMSYEFARQPQKIANKVYANRMGNGNEASGDGWKFRGAGLIQLTGKTNQAAFAKFIEKSIDDIGDYLRTKEGALLSALWYWKNNNLASFGGDIDKVSDIINIGRATTKYGDAIGFADRKAKYDKILAILK